MPRNISFSMTTEQFRNRSKTVTRRLGWRNLKPGEILVACVKCMGLKPGEKIERLGQIRVVNVCREPINRMYFNKPYGDAEAAKEGFPQMTGSEFVEMFQKNMKCDFYQEVTRIEFKYLD